MYMLGTPGSDCGTEACLRDIPADPFIRYQTFGPGACPPGKAVDDGSELRGLNYKASKCSADSYLPGKYSMQGACAAPGNSAPRACMDPTENTRLSNPPCTLRGTGWNRWEWLCWDPQERAIVPFEWNVNYRIVAKDNHVPCLETPLDQDMFMPMGYTDRVPSTREDPSRRWMPQGCAGNNPANAPGNPFQIATSTRNTVQQL